MTEVNSIGSKFMIILEPAFLTPQREISMSDLFRWIVCCFLSVAFLQGCGDSSDSDPQNYFNPVIAQAESTAIEVNEKQLEVWNSLDADKAASLNNYTFVRFNSGQLQMIETHEIYRDVLEKFTIPNTLATEWDHTSWDELEVIQSSQTKVHVAGRFSRFDKGGNRYLTGETLRIVTMQEGHWGIKIRSTYSLSTPDEFNNVAQEDITAAESAAIKVLENYMEARNNRDSESLAELYHYPQALLLDVDLHIFNTKEDYIVHEENSVIYDLDYAEWDHSELDRVEFIQSGVNKVHLTIGCDNINVVGESCGKEEGIWVVTKVADRWAIQGRSMF